MAVPSSPWTEPTSVLLSGEVHYARLDPRRWAEILDRVVDLGFAYVSTYVPWAVHETATHAYDFTGQRDVVGFCELATERGLGVIVRPGPNTGAEQPGSGWPRRVLDDPHCQARRNTGQPYLLATATHHAFMPSYASRATLDEIARWYDEVIPRLAPLQHPDGPVVACQVDNEMAYHFQPHPYALDYHPDAIADYRAWLVEQHGTLDTVNAAYGAAYTRPEDVDPPRDGTDTPELRRIEWIRWREEHLRRSLGALAGMQRERGMDRVPLVHNDYPRTTTPIDTGALERSGAVDIASGDVYATKEGGRFVRDYVRHLSGTTRLPSLGEVGAGWLTLPWLLPMGPTALDAEHMTMRALFAGARRMNVYMLVERDRWFGSPISERAEVRPDRAPLYRRLHSLLAELDWGTLRRHAPALVVENRTSGRRIAARERLGEVVPCFSQLYPLDRRLVEPDDDDRATLDRWEDGFARALDEAEVDHDRAAETASGDLDAYELVCVPTLDAFDPDAWNALREAASRGVTVVCGPRVPSLDGSLREHPFELGGIRLLEDPAEAAGFAPQPRFRSAELDLHLFRGPEWDVLCAVNPTPDPVEATITFDGVVRLVGRWTPETLEGADRVTAHLGPWDVQVWEVAS